MFLGDAFARLARLALISELGQFPMQVALQFIVEHDAKRPASRTFDPCGFLLVEPIERGVMLGFARLHETVIDRLTFGHAARLQEEALGFFRENKEAFAAFRRSRLTGFHCDESLLLETAERHGSIRSASPA